MDFPSEPQRALITGIDSFTGKYLATELRKLGFDVFGTTHHDTPTTNNSRLLPVDLRDASGVAAITRDVKPDVVAHLAAIAFVAHGDASDIYSTNLLGTRNLLSALANCGKKPRGVLLASSANIYGNCATDPIDENQPANPANDYAVSKLAMEYMAALWFDALPITIARPFNYTGVGQSSSFLIPKIVAHFASRSPTIELGNLDVSRDFSDVRDVAAIYGKLLQTPRPHQIFNVCSGKSYALADVLRIMREISGHEMAVQVNPNFVRANEVKILRGSNHKLFRALGTTSAIPFEQTLRWMYDQAKP